MNVQQRLAELAKEKKELEALLATQPSKTQWHQELIWVRRNEQGVLIDMSEPIPVEVTTKCASSLDFGNG